MIAEKLSMVYSLLHNLLQHTDDSATFMDIRPSKMHFQRGMACKGTEYSATSGVGGLKRVDTEKWTREHA